MYHTVQIIITTIIIITIILFIIQCISDVLRFLPNLFQVRPKDINDPARTMNLAMFTGSISAYSSGITPTTQSAALGTKYSTLFTGADTIEVMNRTQYPNVSDFYLDQASRVGLYTYNKKVVIGAVFQPSSGTSGVNATAWYSGQPYHAMPVALAYLMNAFSRQVRIGGGD